MDAFIANLSDKDGQHGDGLERRLQADEAPPQPGPRPLLPAGGVLGHECPPGRW
jgi:hypothetical protein